MRSEAETAIEVRHPRDGVSVIDFEGDLTGASESRLAEAFSRASASGGEAVVFNFTHLEYMNSSGIGLLVTTLIRAQRQGQRLLAYGLNEHYRQIFSLTRLDEAISLHADEADALSAISD
ncbi:MAG TPA: STAS domain-containing protein [Acidimicrobiia bacterium]|nr:STAS domain-containing protein [Acidimicrobiia bacterium]